MSAIYLVDFYVAVLYRVTSVAKVGEEAQALGRTGQNVRRHW